MDFRGKWRGGALFIDGQGLASPSPLWGRVGVEVGVVVEVTNCSYPLLALPHKGGGNPVAPALESGTLRNVFAGRKARSNRRRAAVLAAQGDEGHDAGGVGEPVR